MTPKRKGYDLKEARLEGNLLRGAAAVMGNIDRTGDVIFPGAFQEALAQFREAGFIAVGHDWNDLPVAMPTRIEEKGTRLEAEAMFHTTQRAQDARTVTMERLDRGLSVGLSVGFLPDYDDGYPRFSSGKALLDFAEKQGYDLSLFDVRTLSAHRGKVSGITRIPELYEFSIVPVPANPAAVAVEAKAGIDIHTEREFERFLREAGFSRGAARGITTSGYRAGHEDDEGEPTQRDAADEPDTTRLGRIAEIRSRLLRL